MGFLGRIGLLALIVPVAAVAACSGSALSSHVYWSEDAGTGVGVDGSVTPDRADAHDPLGDGQTADGMTGCLPQTCALANADCGAVADGCGSVVDCGTCPLPKVCGGGGVANRCGVGVCVPTTCAAAGASCGLVGDGCGKTLNCGTCIAPQTCSGSGVANVCGGACIPRTCAQQGFNCGTQGDGCGGVLACGTCTAPQTCGGNGVAGACGTPGCVPVSCAQIGAQCGTANNGCGGLLNCGTCPNGTCGSGGTPNVCGMCTTTVSGTAYAPGHINDPAPPAAGSADPLPNVLVYIPSTPVAAFAPGVACSVCGTPASGTPIASAITDAKGNFVLQNVPAGVNVPLVIQTGRWRRQVVIPAVSVCGDTALPPELTRLPRNKNEGDIPLVAVSTGTVDLIECMFKRIGVDDSEVTLPASSGGTGRIQLYSGNGNPAAGGQTPPGGSVTEDNLWGSPTTLNAYDMVLFGCQAGAYAKTPAALANMVSYANAGGRVLLDHYSYVWLNTNAPFSSTAAWAPDGPYPVDGEGILQTSSPKGAMLASWLFNIGASTTLGRVRMGDLRSDVTAVNAPALQWLTTDPVTSPPVRPLGFSFNTPIGNAPAQQCGRVQFADYHAGFGGVGVYPSGCSTGAMTPQEKLLEYMIFDLGACISAD